jgi:glutamate synthase (NADPH/NADH) small chain
MERVKGAELAIDRKERINTSPPQLQERSPELRVCDFEPTLVSLTPEMAREIAFCCIHCPDPAPCQEACPVNNNIPEAMWLIEAGDFEGAAEVYRETSTLPEICGRVCPHDALCQGACVRNKRGLPVYTGVLEAFVSDYAREKTGVTLPVGKATGKRVAIVGAGPSGLACAAKLRAAGHEVTVFDKNPAPGGLLLYGIPNFKLPTDVVEKRVEDFLQAGVNFELGVQIGPERSPDDLLREGFDAVYLAVGTWVDATMDVPGVDLPGVFQASGFLMQSKVDARALPSNASDTIEIGDRVVVIGGGDTASDCLRAALRVGANDVTCLYRRTEEQMPGNAHDRLHAQEEGAKFQYLTQPIRFLPGPDGRVAEVECLECRLGAVDSSGRRRPVPIEGSNFKVPADTVVLALGYWPDPSIGENTSELATHDWGLIQADPETGSTSRPGIFAGGDAVTGPDLVVTAMRSGHRAANSINQLLAR